MDMPTFKGNNSASNILASLPNEDRLQRKEFASRVEKTWQCTQNFASLKCYIAVKAMLQCQNTVDSRCLDFGYLE